MTGTTLKKKITSVKHKPAWGIAMPGGLINDDELRVMCCRCCRHSTGIKHFNVERTPTTFYLKDIQFPTLDQLVRYYSHTDVPNKEQIAGVRLKFPIPRGRGTTSYLSLYEDDDRRLSAGPDVYIHPVR